MVEDELATKALQKIIDAASCPFQGRLRGFAGGLVFGLGSLRIERFELLLALEFLNRARCLSDRVRFAIGLHRIRQHAVGFLTTLARGVAGSASGLRSGSVNP